MKYSLYKSLAKYFVEEDEDKHGQKRIIFKGKDREHLQKLKNKIEKCMNKQGWKHLIDYLKGGRSGESYAVMVNQKVKKVVLILTPDKYEEKVQKEQMKSVMLQQITYKGALTYMGRHERNMIYIKNFSDDEEYYKIDGGEEALLDLELEEYSIEEFNKFQFFIAGRR